METLSPFVSTLPVFFLMNIAIYLVGYYITFRNWSGLSRPEASSSLLSLSHGTPAVLLATYSIFHHHHHHHHHHPTISIPLGFAFPNTAIQNTVLEYSIAYFLTDLFHYVLFLPNDLLFIAHHLATLYVFLTCRYIVNHGAFAVLILLVLAEVTSPCQNTWSLARLRRADSSAAAGVYEFLSPLFFSFYSVVRGVLGPVFVYRMGVFYSSGGADGVIPKWVWVSWMAVIVGAILGSMFWVLNLWIDLYRERSKKQVKKWR